RDFGIPRDAQTKVYRLGLGDVDVDTLLGKRSESLQFGDDIIDAHRQRVQTVNAFAIADFGTNEPCFGVPTRDRGARNRAALGIEYAASDVASCLLRPDWS